MIVRILTEGQYRLQDSAQGQLNDLDNRMVQAVASGNREEYQRLLSQMLELIRSGEVVPVEELIGSDIVFPSPDTTFDEAKGIFIGEGLIPG
ncbi:MAG: hypothetical protein HW403_365 [Dehalococcoidia bacterium]|nr:hypothetical protein [Dehalococcoidia bacterium]